MQHLDEGTIHAWLDGALPADQAADVERHVHECAECAALVADARGVIAGAARIVSALDDVPGGVIPKQRVPATSRSLWRSLRLTPFRAALAASLLVAVASLAVDRRAQRETVRPAPVMAVQASDSPAANAPKMEVVDLSAPAKRSRPNPTVALAPAPAPSAAPADRRMAERRADTAVSSELRKASIAVVDSARAGRTGVVATNALAPAVVSAAPPVAPSAAAGAVADARASSRDALLRREVPAQPFSLVLASADERPLTLPGCYQLVRDSAGPASPLPSRFSLENSIDPDAPRNVVRAVTGDGRRDSLIAGITWRAALGADRVVLVSNNGGGSISSLRSQSLNQGAGGRGVLGFAGATPARITRIDCR